MMAAVHATVQLAEYAERLSQAPHGEAGAIVQEAAASLGVSVATVQREMQRFLGRRRTKRADAGDFSLTLEEARWISAYLMEGYRKNGKKNVPIGEAVEALRANGKIVAGRVDVESGEIIPLSHSSVSRALRAYQLHPEQLRRPSPHVNLKSNHPNHVWQVDASVCVLYYLPDGSAALMETDQAVHYKNKPENLQAIEQFRVIRYVLTDHATGLDRWRYYPHSESGEHTVRFLAWAMAPKADPKKDPFGGAPRILMVDPGATAAGLVQRFCRRVGIDLIVNKARNARSKGSVEGGQNRVETVFEQGLRYQKSAIRSIDDLNAVAEWFQLHYNASRVHGRHGMTRMAAWMHITPEQYRVTPSAEVLLSLATHEPTLAKIQGDLTVQFKGRLWDVQEVPGAMVGEKLAVHWHPFIADTAMAVLEDAAGQEVHLELPEKLRTVDPAQGLWGFVEGANTIGEKHHPHKDTVADTHRKELAALAAGTRDLDEAEKKRKRRDYEAFDGQIDPFKSAREAVLPDYLPRQGTALDVGAPRVERLPVPFLQAAERIRTAVGAAWNGEVYSWLESRYGESGVPEEAIEGLIAQIAQNAGAQPEAARPGKLTVVK